MEHLDYMAIALEEAQKAYSKNEVPIGAIIVKDGEIIARAHNLRVETEKSTAHAEILAIERANDVLESWRLDSCTMYVTIEPCPMCAGAIIQSRISEVYYGAMDIKAGSHRSIVNLFDKTFNHKVKITGGLMEEECGEIIKRFFHDLRKK